MERPRSGSDLEGSSENLSRMAHMIEEFTNRYDNLILFFESQYFFAWKVDEEHIRL